MSVYTHVVKKDRRNKTLKNSLHFSTQQVYSNCCRNLIKIRQQQMEQDGWWGKKKKNKRGIFYVSACVTVLTPSAAGTGLFLQD